MRDPKDPDEIISLREPPKQRINGWQPGGASPNPGGYSSEQRAFNKRFRKLGDKAYDLIEQCLDGTSKHALDLDPEFRTKVAMWTIERGFGSRVPMPKEDEEKDPMVAGTLTVVFVPAKKEGE